MKKKNKKKRIPIRPFKEIYIKNVFRLIMCVAAARRICLLNST